MSVQVISGTDGVTVRGTYATISLAIANASTVNGDIINVPAGSYTEAISITKKLTLQGAKSSHVADASGRLVQTGETILLNCTISVPSNGSIIRNLGIVRTSNSSVDQLSITGSGTEATTVENCWLERYTTDSASVTARALYMYAGARAILKNNMLTGSITDNRTVFSYKTWSHAIWFNSGGANIVAEDNTIENCRSALNIDDLPASQTIAVNGNTFRNCGTYVSFGGVNAPTGSYVLGTDSANPNIFVDPGMYATTIINLSKCAATFRLNMTSNKYKPANSSAVKFSELDTNTLHVINARTVHMTTAKPGLVIYKAANLFVNAYIFQTMAGAISYSSSNDTINIAAGTFSENVSITTPLTLKGAGATTVIQGTNTDYSIAVSSSNVTLDSLKINQIAGGKLLNLNGASNVTLPNVMLGAADAWAPVDISGTVSGIDLTGVTYGLTAVNIKNAGVTYGFASENVKLPAGLIYEYKSDSPAQAVLTNSRALMRTAAAKAALTSIDSIYGSNLQSGVTLYEDASYNLVLAASKAIVTENKIINFGAESAIPAIKSDQYAIKVGEQIRVYDLSSAAVPHELYASQVVYLMPDSVRTGVPVLPKDVKAVASNDYQISLAIDSAAGVRALQWYVKDSNDRLYLGQDDVKIQGTVDVINANAVDIIDLIELNGVSNASATVSSDGGLITGLEPTQRIPIKNINKTINVPSGSTLTIDVSGQQPIKIVEPSGVTIDLNVLDKNAINATLSLTPGAGQVAAQVLGPGTFVINTIVPPPPNTIGINLPSPGFIINENGRVVSTVGSEVSLTQANGTFTIQQPEIRVVLY